MNTIAIAIRINDKVAMIGGQYPKLTTLKAIARYKLGRLKRKVRNACNIVERMAVNRVVDRVAMAFNPMPCVALA